MHYLELIITCNCHACKIAPYGTEKQVGLDVDADLKKIYTEAIHKCALKFQCEFYSICTEVCGSPKYR